MKKGAALLISILVLGVLLLSFATIGAHGFLLETAALTSLAQKKQADSLATACLETALYKLAIDENYQGNETIIVEARSCEIRPVLFDDGEWIIETEAMNGDSTSRLRITLRERLPVSISNWEEIEGF